MTTPTNGRDAKISDLLGISKQNSDLYASQVKVRYTESTSVGSGRFMRILFPKRSNDAMLDCRSIRMRFMFKMISTDVLVRPASSDIRCIINRIRVLSGSNVIHDLTEASSAFTLESLCNTSMYDSKYQRKIEGNTLLDGIAQANNTEYIVNVTPKGTLLNSDVLLPLSRMSDLSLEYYLESPNRALHSPANDTTADFSINNIEFLCDYIQSPSITNYFNTHGVKFHCSDIAHRYNAILSQEHVLRLSSSHSSLNGILNVIRTASDVTDITKQFKYESFYSGANREKYNLLVNNQLLYEQDIDSTQQTWKELVSLFPNVKSSVFFDGAYATTKNVLATSTLSAPVDFRSKIISGVNTSQLNSDITYRVRLIAAPAVALRSDSFLYSDIYVSLPAQGRDLIVKF